MSNSKLPFHISRRTFTFPSVSLGNHWWWSAHSSSKWFQRWPWLHYDEDRDLAFCFTCVVVYTNNHLYSTPFLELSFISMGFSYWKDAVTKFTWHASSQCHKDAVLKTIMLLSTSKDVGEPLDTQLASERSQQRKCSLKLLSNAHLLARQGLAFHGDGKESNFMRLLHLCAEDDAKGPGFLTGWGRKPTNTLQEMCRMRWWRWWFCTSCETSLGLFRVHHSFLSWSWSTKWQVCQTRSRYIVVCLRWTGCPQTSSASSPQNAMSLWQRICPFLSSDSKGSLPGHLFSGSCPNHILYWWSVWPTWLPNLQHVWIKGKILQLPSHAKTNYSPTSIIRTSIIRTPLLSECFSSVLHINVYSIAP